MSERELHFSIVICATRSTPIGQLVRALLAQTIPVDGNEIVIVGQMRGALARGLDQARGTLGARCEVRCVDLGVMPTTHGWNLAIPAARHDLLLLLADDLVPSPTWLASHLRLHRSRPEPTVVGLGPIHLEARAPCALFCEGATGPVSGVVSAVTDRLSAGSFHAANTSMKRTLWRAAGGFDEMFLDEVVYGAELGVRLLRMGMQLIHLKDAIASSTKRVTLVHQWRRMRKAGESAALLRLRHPDEPISAQAEPRAGQCVRHAFAAWARWLMLRHSDARELARQHLLASAFVSGLQRGRARVERHDSIPPPPLFSTSDQPTLAALEGERECYWVAGAPRAHIGGLEPVDVFDGYGLPARRNGLDCLSFRNPDGASQAYFAIDRSHGFAERSVEVEIEVFVGTEGGAVRLDYDSTDLSVWIPPHVRGAFKATPAQVVPAGSAWQPVRFTIDDARFCRSLHGTDFRVVSTGASEKLDLRCTRVALRESDRVPRVVANSAAFGFDEVADPRVSIVIPTRDRLELLQQCLQSLQANTPPVYEVIVVDDGSLQGLSEALESVAGLQLVRLPVNVGFARACNAGAARARAPLLLFLNNDTVPLTGWLEPMLEALQRNIKVGVVGSRLLYPRLGLVQHAGIEIDGRGLPFHPYRLEPSEAPEVNEDRVLPAVTGACLLVRRSLFERLRGFDVEFRNGYEDVDLCLRACDYGFLTLYCNRSILLHYESASEGRMDSNAANVRLFLTRWGNRETTDAGSSEGTNCDKHARDRMTADPGNANHLPVRPAVFLHIQKTAGTSITETVWGYYADSIASHGDFMCHTAESMQHYRFVSGHFGFEFARKLIETRYSFTFLRDPVERVLSLYYFAQSQNPDELSIYRMAQDLDLDSFLLAGRAPGLIRDYIYNHQTWQLSWGRGAPDRYTLDSLSDEQMLALAKANIKKFSYLGFAETFDDDYRRVLADLGIPVPEKAVHANASPSRPRKDSLPSRTLAIVRELTGCDQVLYDTAWAMRRTSLRL